MVHKFASSLVDGLLVEHLVPSFVTLPVACAIFCLFRHPVAISATKYEHARAFYMQGFGLHPYIASAHGHVHEEIKEVEHEKTNVCMFSVPTQFEGASEASEDGHYMSLLSIEMIPVKMAPH